MKAIDFLEQASLICRGAAPDEMLKASGVSLINTILADLNESPVKTLSSELYFSEQGRSSCLTNGLCMLICLLDGDDFGLSSFSELYNSTRKKSFGSVGKIRSALFGGESV